MDNRKVIYKLAIASAMLVSLIGCKSKWNEIDNNQVISKPYVLFVADSSGAIFKTNDGFNFETVFNPDNYPVFSMVTSGNNLIFIKKNTHYIVNPSQGNSTSNPTLTLPGGPAGFDRSMLIAVQEWNNRVYIGGLSKKGLMLNDSLGAPGYNQSNWRGVADTFLGNPGVITSFTRLKDGSLIAYDNAAKRFYRKTSLGEEFSPNLNANGLPANRNYFTSHIANTILAADVADSGKLYYSTDFGANFQAYTGLPVDAKILTVEAPFDQTILVGTRSHGVFRLPLGSTQFVPSSLGLPAGGIITCIISKYDYFKNDRSKQYTYAATNKGLYRSEDNGENWVKVWDGPGGNGNFVTLY